MKRTHHIGMVEGVGTAVGAVILASVGFLAGCAPGTICDKPGYENECLTGGSGGSASGSGGSGGSMSSGTGGSGGTPAATGGMGGSTPAKATCKLWPTKEEVAEKLVVAKCGMPGNVACHAMTFPPKFTNSAEAVMVMLDKPPTLYCRNDKMINKADPAKSFIVTKVRGTAAMVSCPTGGGNGGAKMPFMPQPALSADEADCLEWWAFEVSK
jgi:hypothetical protein